MIRVLFTAFSLLAAASGSILEYEKIEETIAPVVLDTLSSWILETTNIEKIPRT